jgi:hypothetical protein
MFWYFLFPPFLVLDFIWNLYFSFAWACLRPFLLFHFLLAYISCTRGGLIVHTHTHTHTHTHYTLITFTPSNTLSYPFFSLPLHFVLTIFFFQQVLGFERRGSRLRGRCSATWYTPPALFTLVIFKIWSCIVAWLIWTISLLPMPSTYASSSWLGSLPQLLACWFWWSLSNVLPRLASNCNPPDLCLPNSWVYRHWPPHKACNF